MDNMAVWNKLKKPPPSALKNITGGRLRGMTDICPQWRYAALTEVFGQCGAGWRYHIVKLWTEPGIDGQMFAFAQINLFIKNPVSGDATGNNITWQEAIPGIGGSMLLEKQKGTIHHNDEAFKMAVTDALSVASKMLGVASSIYENNANGTKYQQTYLNQADEKTKKTTTKKNTNLTPVNLNPAEPAEPAKTAGNFGFLGRMANAKEAIKDMDYYRILGSHGFEHANEIPVKDQKKIIDNMLAFHEQISGGCTDG